MILFACREVAKHTPFLLSEFGPRNAATEEELRIARETMRPNLLRKNGPRAACISEWEKSGVVSNFISSGRFSRTMSNRKKALRLLTLGIPAVFATSRIDETLLLYRGEKSAKPHRENSNRPARVLLSIKRQKTGEMSEGFLASCGEKAET
jgi:hypothetical protein